MIVENKEMGIRFGVKGNEDFEKWLAEHDKQIRAGAIDECLKIVTTRYYCSSAQKEIEQLKGAGE